MGPEGSCTCTTLCSYKEVLNLKQGAKGQSRLTNMFLFILWLQFWFHMLASDDGTLIWSTDMKDNVPKTEAKASLSPSAGWLQYRS